MKRRRKKNESTSNLDSNSKKGQGKNTIQNILPKDGENVPCAIDSSFVQNSY